MALNTGYVIKETANNLLRNVTLSLATMVTIAITLSMVGGVSLINKGLERSQGQFRGNVEFIIFMKPDASPDQIDSVGRSLADNPQVRDTRYLDQDAAYAEFKELYPDNPTFVESIDASVLPTSYKVHVTDGSSDVVQSLMAQYRTQPGVHEITGAPDRIERQERSFGRMRAGLLVFSALVGSASLVLIYNSIRTAMFARRREIEVMKLVGATNWFIQVPFMCEALVQAMVGVLISLGLVLLTTNQLLPYLQEGGGVWAQFRVTNSDVFEALKIIVPAGIVVAIAGSTLAVRRFLRV